jgi:hypothetical protein
MLHSTSIHSRRKTKATGPYHGLLIGAEELLLLLKSKKQYITNISEKDPEGLQIIHSS